MNLIKKVFSTYACIAEVQPLTILEVTDTMSHVTGDTEKFTMRFSVTYLLICRNKRRYLIQNMCILYFEF